MDAGTRFSCLVFQGDRREPGSMARSGIAPTNEREDQTRPRQLIADVCFSNRPIGVKRFQAIQHCGLDVAHGLVLLYGLGAKALPSWDPRTRWNNLLGGLSFKRTVGPSRHANSPHPSSRQGHYFTAWWSSSFLLSHWILSGLMLLQLLWSI